MFPASCEKTACVTLNDSFNTIFAARYPSRLLLYIQRRGWSWFSGWHWTRWSGIWRQFDRCGRRERPKHSNTAWVLILNHCDLTNHTLPFICHWYRSIYFLHLSCVGWPHYCITSTMRATSLVFSCLNKSSLSRFRLSYVLDVNSGKVDAILQTQMCTILR